MLDMLVEALTRLSERTDSRIHRNLHAKLTLFQMNPEKSLTM